MTDSEDTGSKKITMAEEHADADEMLKVAIACGSGLEAEFEDLEPLLRDLELEPVVPSQITLGWQQEGVSAHDDMLPWVDLEEDSLTDTKESSWDAYKMHYIHIYI